MSKPPPRDYADTNATPAPASQPAAPESVHLPASADGDTLAIGAESNAAVVYIPFAMEEFFSAGGIPNPDRAIVAGGQNAAFVNQAVRMRLPSALQAA